MGRPATVQITRHSRTDNSVTYSLRVRMSGGDETVALGNSTEGWDESRAERARRQLLAKIELGQWTPGSTSPSSGPGEEPTFAELATDWLVDRERNPGIRARTIDDDRWRLTRYLIPFFGNLRPSQITPLKIKQYRRRIHEENQQIRAARQGGEPLLDTRTASPLRTLSNDSINKTLRTLAAILDDAEDAGWVARNVARGRRMREPVERRTADVLVADELEVLLDAATDLDGPHKPATVARAQQVRGLRDEARLQWKEIASRVGVSTSNAIYLYSCSQIGHSATGPRTAAIATLAFTGLRVSEFCALDLQDIDLRGRKIHVRDAKTAAGIRVVDIRPRLLDILSGYAPLVDGPPSDAPAFSTRTGRRRDRNNVRARVLVPTLNHANTLRADRGERPILAHVTPHTFRRTYATVMLAAGFDLPYVQDQLGHDDPTTTLAIYARVIRRPDRETVRAEMRALLGEDRSGEAGPPLPTEPRARFRLHGQTELRGLER